MGEEHSDDFAAEFERIVADLAETSHGSDGLDDLCGHLQRMKRTSRRAKFLEARLAREPVRWGDCCRQIWDRDEDRHANRFPFLQGDVVQSSLVRGLSGSSAHDLWMTLAPDCDNVRAPFIRVGKVIGVKADDDDRKRKFAIATTFRSPKFFPLPRLPGDPHELLGHIVDLEVPYYLDFSAHESQRDSVVSVASLTESGWHILNAVLLHATTRSKERTEAVAIRNFTPPSDEELSKQLAPLT